MGIRVTENYDKKQVHIEVSCTDNPDVYVRHSIPRSSFPQVEREMIAAAKADALFDFASLLAKFVSAGESQQQFTEFVNAEVSKYTRRVSGKDEVLCSRR